jgi:hypothetical protein
MKTGCEVRPGAVTGVKLLLTERGSEVGRKGGREDLGGGFGDEVFGGLVVEKREAD